ncbi:MAG: hypothetical protein Q8910_00845 [Bacteroidota bacterium]|nr:hypothetical protein [Bacteroidota bacterium]
MSNIQPEVLKTLRSNTLRKVNQGNKRTHSFKVDFSDINEEFTGRFTFHYPSQMEVMQAGVVKSALLGGNLSVDMTTDNIATIVSTLDTVLDEFPEWFNVFDPDIEYEISESIFLEYVNWRDSFRKRPKDSKPSGDSQDGRSEVPMVGTEDV